jgi:uncharacterized protein with HEPN domain
VKELSDFRIVAFRDFIAHNYFGINREAVWETIKEDLPIVKGIIAKLLAHA